MDGATIGLGLVVIVIGLIFRLAASFVSVQGGDLNMKERLFIAAHRQRITQVDDVGVYTCWHRIIVTIQPESSLLVVVEQFALNFVSNRSHCA